MIHHHARHWCCLETVRTVGYVHVPAESWMFIPMFIHLLLCAHTSTGTNPLEPPASISLHPSPPPHQPSFSSAPLQRWVSPTCAALLPLLEPVEALHQPRLLHTRRCCCCHCCCCLGHAATHCGHTTLLTGTLAALRHIQHTYFQYSMVVDHAEGVTRALNGSAKSKACW
jgi:hypothetical protein